MNSAKRFDIIRTIISVLIALAISFVIIFMVSDQPLEAIKYLLIGPLTNKRSMGNVVESMIPLIFTGTGVCIMFSANQINLAGRRAAALYPGTVFWEQNWRKGGLQDRRNQLLKEHDFYNQQYCGCEFSMRRLEEKE